MIDLNFKYKELVYSLEKDKPFKPELSIILGSGLGGFTENVKIHKTIKASRLQGYPPSTIEGHEGKIHFAEYAGKKILLFQGRIHFYEGYPITQCILPVFTAYKLGCRKMFITNAAGGINPIFKPGDLMLADSLNGILIKKELKDLIGIASLEGKLNFYNFPSQKLNRIIKNAALEEKISLKEGTYWYTKGPSYETPSEIKMVRTFGGDAVGMSTVHEAVYSAYLGMETSAVSCITNYAAGITSKKLSHSEVTETANQVKDKFERLVKRIIKMI